MAEAEPKNAASEWMRATYRLMNDFASPPSGIRASFLDDYTYEDRRRGPTSFATLDAELGARLFASFWDTGAGRPHFTVAEILAVRGDRLVAGRFQVDYDNGFAVGSIELIELDATLRMLQRVVDFDVDDVDGAIAELDRLHNQSDTR